ncbi:MAG: hypothetical protein O7E52_25135 [Candidatus Poribacteria bacterium]|nr:hypothetical protein [Candidatus Poribacteria bacterium]
MTTPYDGRAFSEAGGHIQKKVLCRFGDNGEGGLKIKPGWLSAIPTLAAKPWWAVRKKADTMCIEN